MTLLRGQLHRPIAAIIPSQNGETVLEQYSRATLLKGSTVRPLKKAFSQDQIKDLSYSRCGGLCAKHK